MLILNFTHPITSDQQAQIEKFAGLPVTEIRDIRVRIEQGEALAYQISAIVDSIQLTPEEWQAQPLLINPPGLAPATSVLLAELHGRLGHFPTLIRLRPKSGPTPAYEVAELLSLQAVRDAARLRR